jgi:uncharacterized repeat protein (TIGR03803 family)
MTGVRSEVSRASSQAARVSVIYSLKGAPLSSTPEAGLIADTRGNLYGTASYGGVPNSECSIGCGTAFELSPEKGGTWNETVLYSFNNPMTGLYPSNPLIFDAPGNLYGSTQVGDSFGVAYELLHYAGGWRYKVRHNFVGGSDGQQPRSGLMELNGKFYGTTVAGGNGGSGGNGTVFELLRRGGWKERIIHPFLSYGDGTNPQAGLTSDSSGNLYGTTSYGGLNKCAGGCGTVFKLLPSRGGRWSEKVLHQFTGSDGALPVANLIWDASGNLYGSAEFGGDSSCVGGGCGTIFKLRRGNGNSWQLSVVYAFPKQSQGADPAGNMVFDGSGNLYGTTVSGGNVNACPQPGGCGVVFELSHGGRKWKYSVLHIFNNTPDGALPNGLVSDGTGKYFGTTIGGGIYSMGTAFELVP